MSMSDLTKYMGAGGLRSVGSSNPGAVDRPSLQLLAQLVEDGGLPDKARRLTISEPGREFEVSVHGGGPDWLMTIASRSVDLSEHALVQELDRSNDAPSPGMP
jgi:hypothetical protein